MNNNCQEKKCGCKDTYLTTPPPCPDPVGCPDAQPCSEVFDAQCIIYTGEDVLCDQDTVITQNSSVAVALQAIVDYFCTAISNIPATPNLWLTFLGDTGSASADTTTDTFSIVGDGTFIETSITGDVMTVSYIGDPGVKPWQFVNASSFGTYTTQLTADSRTVYNISAPGGAVFITPPTPPAGTEIEILFIGSCNVSIQPGIPTANTTVSIWQPAGLITADGDLSEMLEWNAVTATTEGLRIKLVCTQNSGGGIKWYVLDQTWNDQVVAVV